MTGALQPIVFEGDNQRIALQYEQAGHRVPEFYLGRGFQEVYGDNLQTAGLDIGFRHIVTGYVQGRISKPIDYTLDITSNTDSLTMGIDLHPRNLLAMVEIGLGAEIPDTRELNLALWLGALSAEQMIGKKPDLEKKAHDAAGILVVAGGPLALAEVTLVAATGSNVLTIGLGGVLGLIGAHFAYRGKKNSSFENRIRHKNLELADRLASQYPVFRRASA